MGEGKAVLTLPGYDERVLLLGANGSGKSVLATMLIEQYPRWFIFDAKWDFEPRNQDYVTVHSPTDRRWNSDRVLYRPTPEFTTGPQVAFVLRRIFYQARKDRLNPKKRRIVYLDEGLFAARTGAAQWLANLAITGRALHIGLWVGSQRPSWIPVEIRTEAWRVFLFFLKRHDDRKEAIDLSDNQLTEDQLRSGTTNYAFYELRRMPGGRVKVTHFPPVNPNAGEE